MRSILCTRRCKLSRVRLVRAGLGFKFGAYKLSQRAGSNVCSREAQAVLKTRGSGSTSGFFLGATGAFSVSVARRGNLAQRGRTMLVLAVPLFQREMLETLPRSEAQAV
jgi:hypothetical protein